MVLILCLTNNNKRYMYLKDKQDLYPAGTFWLQKNYIQRMLLLPSEIIHAVIMPKFTIHFGNVRAGS